MRRIDRPQPGEYAPYTVEYFDLVPPGNVLDLMATQMEVTTALLNTLPDDTLAVPHRQGEWTVKEIVQHVSDDERIYAYRALRFARGDDTELPGFEQDAYSAVASANRRPLDDLLGEYITVRQATVSLFEGLPDDALRRIGTANGNVMSVRAAALHILGHELHHLASIEEHYGPFNSP
jgi:uncharacterized damage-inducible protein DinB